MEPQELVPGTLIQSGGDFGVILSEVGGGGSLVGLSPPPLGSNALSR